MPTAVLIDGGYLVKRFRDIELHNAYNAERAADCIFCWAVAHFSNRPAAKVDGRSSDRRDLYRVFFYECPPLQKKMHNPISKRGIDFSKYPEAIFRQELHSRLPTKRKLALRLGQLSTDAPWTIKPGKVTELLAGKRDFSELTPDDVISSVRQKGIDMRIGVDVAPLAFKKQVDQIVLFAGYSDFVPAAKWAKREGIDFILDPLWRSISPGLKEHIDGLRSTCPKPIPRTPKEVAAC